MQSVAGAADGDNVVESHKLVRVLRAYRDNPQVRGDPVIAHDDHQ
jgi:hypothetical protein